MTNKPIYRYAGHAWDEDGWTPLLAREHGAPIAPGEGDIRRWLDHEADPDQRAEYRKALTSKPSREPTAADRKRGRTLMSPVEGDGDMLE